MAADGRQLSRVSIIRALCIVLAALVSVDVGHTQASARSDAISFFLDRPPTDSDLARLPNTARDVVIAKVRIVGRVSYLGRRDESGLPSPGPRPRDLFGARIDVLDVLSGPIVTGAQLYVTFGEPGGGRNYVFPVTPRALELSYFITAFTDQDGVRRLAGFRVSQGEYEEWHKAWLEYERMRGRPGARD